MKTTAELVDDALVGVREYLSSTPPNVPEDWEDSPKLRHVDGEHPIDHGKVARLRLDWELIDVAGVQVENNEHVARLIVEQLKWDLVDIIENGDIDIVNDPMLKAMNGAKKLGKTPQRVVIEELVYYREKMEKKKCYEYTVFLLLSVDWEE